MVFFPWKRWQTIGTPTSCECQARYTAATAAGTQEGLLGEGRREGGREEGKSYLPRFKVVLEMWGWVLWLQSLWEVVKTSNLMIVQVKLDCTEGWEKEREREGGREGEGERGKGGREGEGRRGGRMREGGREGGREGRSSPLSSGERPAKSW